MKLPYYILDVFTRDRLAGNPLAVVLKADGLSDARMQAIAREFDLSETVFVLSPKGERHNALLRIFTPTTELPFAGHPTIGAAVLLGLQSRVSAVRLELGVGQVTAVMERIDKRTGEAKFALPQASRTFGPRTRISEIAMRLGLGEGDIGLVTCSRRFIRPDWNFPSCRCVTPRRSRRSRWKSAAGRILNPSIPRSMCLPRRPMSAAMITRRACSRSALGSVRTPPPALPLQR